MTLVDFKKIFPNCPHGFDETLCRILNATFEKFEINTPLRVAAFCAQVGHECGDFKYKEEIASGEAYEGRKDLGNTQPGDGKRYKGRGFLMLTGRSGYTEYGNALGIDLVGNPGWAANLPVASDIAGLYWQKHGLNALADASEFAKITKRINGGLTNQEDREKRYARAKQVLGIP